VLYDVSVKIYVFTRIQNSAAKKKSFVKPNETSSFEFPSLTRTASPFPSTRLYSRLSRTMAPPYESSSGRSNGSSRSRPHNGSKPYSRPTQADALLSNRKPSSINHTPSIDSSHREQQDGLLSGLRSFITAPFSWLSGGGKEGGGEKKKKRAGGEGGDDHARSGSSSSAGQQQQQQALPPPPPQRHKSNRLPSHREESPEDLESGFSTSPYLPLPPARAPPPSSSSSASRRYLPTSQSMPYLDAPVPDPYERPIPRAAPSPRKHAPPPSSGRQGGLTRSSTINFSAIDEGRDDEMMDESTNRGEDRWMDRYARREESVPVSESEVSLPFLLLSRTASWMLIPALIFLSAGCRCRLQNSSPVRPRAPTSLRPVPSLPISIGSLVQPRSSPWTAKLAPPDEPCRSKTTERADLAHLDSLLRADSEAAPLFLLESLEASSSGRQPKASLPPSDRPPPSGRRPSPLAPTVTFPLETLPSGSSRCSRTLRRHWTKLVRVRWEEFPSWANSRGASVWEGSISRLQQRRKRRRRSEGRS
jgi:hypothetical protein